MLLVWAFNFEPIVDPTTGKAIPADINDYPEVRSLQITWVNFSEHI